MMPRSRASMVSIAMLSTLGAATTWLALLSWRGFVEWSGHFLGSLFVLGIVLVASGTFARWWRAPAPVVVLVQVLSTSVLASAIITGSPLPVGSAWTRLKDAFGDAVDSANQFAPPVPHEVPAVDPILIVGGLGCMLLVDVLACTLRRIPLAGLPLLTIFSVPLSMLGSGPAWYVFGLTALGFLAMLFVHEDEQVSRWGRALERETGGTDADAFGVRTGAIRANASAIAGVVTALALVVPVVIPTFDLRVFDFGPGSGGNGDINIENPMVDLRRDLIRGDDNDLLEIVTDDPDPSYLRIAVLNRFRSEAWSSGNRDVPTSNQASGPMPPLEGVGGTVGRTEYEYDVTATDFFKSSWLPTQDAISRIEAPGDWRYDLATRDFLASDDDLDTSGLEWDFTAVELDLDATELALAAPTSGRVSEEFTELPSELDDEVRRLTLLITENAASRFEKAVALQTWFRRDGGFTYDDSTPRENGADDLTAFLREGPGGRTGYCEQFAASMAVMARTLGIPARVAVGFLRPDQVGENTFVYSAHDLHAWPELYISGAGWVRFEPTPGGRAESVPDYTRQPVNIPTDDPTVNPGEDPIRDPGRDTESASPESQDDEAGNAGSDGGVPWLPRPGDAARARAGPAPAADASDRPRSTPRGAARGRTRGRLARAARHGPRPRPALAPRAHPATDRRRPGAVVRRSSRRAHAGTPAPRTRRQPGRRRRSRPGGPGPRAEPLRRARARGRRVVVGRCRDLRRRPGRRLDAPGPPPRRVVAAVGVRAGDATVSRSPVDSTEDDRPAYAGVVDHVG